MKMYERCFMFLLLISCYIFLLTLLLYSRFFTNPFLSFRIFSLFYDFPEEITKFLIYFYLVPPLIFISFPQNPNPFFPPPPFLSFHNLSHIVPILSYPLLSPRPLPHFQNLSHRIPILSNPLFSAPSFRYFYNLSHRLPILSNPLLSRPSFLSFHNISHRLTILSNPLFPPLNFFRFITFPTKFQSCLTHYFHYIHFFTTFPRQSQTF